MRPADLSPWSAGGGNVVLVGEFLDRLGLADVTLVGNDSGGAITQMLISGGAPWVGPVVLAKKRPPPARARCDAALLAEIKRVHKENGEVYGARKVWLRLHREHIACARCTVERLMRQAGMAGARRGRRTRTTIPADRAAWPPDLASRDFHAAAPGRRGTCAYLAGPGAPRMCCGSMCFGGRCTPRSCGWAVVGAELGWRPARRPLRPFSPPG
jgi:pimeloyl-ACP methyl ester carboxylesterase